MKTKKFKRVLTLVLALAMMLSISMVAFATDTVTLYVNGVSQGSFNIGTDTTVYDIVAQLSTATWSSDYDANPTYSPLCLPGTLNGKYNGKITYLRYLNGVGSLAYEPIDGALDEDDYYIPTQVVDTVLMDADEALEDYGGLEYWLGNGYGIAADYQHMVYIGWDWEFTVDNVKPGLQLNPSDPNYEAYNHIFQYTMRESLLTSNNNRIDLNYVASNFVFDTAA